MVMHVHSPSSHVALACKPAMLHLALRTWISGPRYLALRTWVSGLRQMDAGFHSQNLGFRTQTDGRWVSLSELGFQDSDRWTLGFTLGTWASGPRYFALKTWVSEPRQTHKYRTLKALHPTVVLSFSRHFSLCP